MSQGGQISADEKDGRPQKDSRSPVQEKHPTRERSEANGSKDQAGSHRKPDPEEKKPPPFYKRPAVIIVASLLALVLLIGGILYWLHARKFESTDDAYVDGHVTQISPQVPALVVALHITDNQFVAKGDLLIELDPTDYQVALEQAEAQRLSAQGRLLQAQSQIGAAQAAVVQAKATIEAAQVSFDNTTRDLKRYQEVDTRARSQQQLDSALAAAKNAEAQLNEAVARKTSAEANVATAEAAVKAAQGEVRTAEANVHRAQINLGYCRIYAPTDGRITQRTIEPGAYVQTGQAMFSLVSPDVWVTANFKETQLKLMRPGLPVTIKIDAFPGQEFRGRVDSIQAGSGSRFSILPAENATGNFVKVVQRVPVKILFDYGPNTDNGRQLTPGLSVIPKVKVR